MSNRLLYLLIFFVLSSAMRGQEYKVEHITIANGLSQNSALSIIQDEKGFIWIGTKDGLNRFDGASFTVFKHEHNKSSLVNNNIRCLYQDTEGNIWIGTNNGLSRLNPKTEKFISFQKSDSVNLNSNVITSILEGRNKNMWIGTYNGLNKLVTSTDPSDGRQFKIERSVFNKLKNKIITCLFEDNENNLWIGTRARGLFCYSENSGNINNFSIPSSPGKKNTSVEISSIARWSDKELLVGTFGQGTYIFI